jgi:hypothetical protein
MFVNDTGLLHFSYRRYLEKKIRDRFGLFGNPLKLVLRAGDAKSAPPPGRARKRAGPTSPQGGEVKRARKRAGPASPQGREVKGARARTPRS